MNDLDTQIEIVKEMMTKIHSLEDLDDSLFLDIENSLDEALSFYNKEGIHGVLENAD